MLPILLVVSAQIQPKPNPIRLPSMALVLHVQTRDDKPYTNVDDFIPGDELEQHTLATLQSRGYNAAILELDAKELALAEIKARQSGFQFAFFVDIQQSNTRRSWVGHDYQTETQAILRILDLKHKQVVFDKTLRFGTSEGWFRNSVEQATAKLASGIDAAVDSVDLENLFGLKYLGQVFVAGEGVALVRGTYTAGTRVGFYRAGAKVMDPTTGEIHQGPETWLGEGVVRACGDTTSEVYVSEVVGRIREGDIVRGCR
jgi:hypothetical protein